MSLDDMRRELREKFENLKIEPVILCWLTQRG